MQQFLITWFATALSLFVTAYLVPGLTITGFMAAGIGAIVLGLVNATFKPIFLILTLPLTFLTLGLFLFVVNAITLGLVGYLTPGFYVSGFFPAVIGSIVLSLVSSFVNHFISEEEEGF